MDKARKAGLPARFRVFRCGLLPLIVLLLVPQWAFARQLHIQRFDAQITVNPDASIDVNETIDIQFVGEWHGIYRTIPVDYTTHEGFNFTIFLDQISATGPDGEHLKVEIQKQGYSKRLKIYVPDAVDTSKVITLHYRALSALRFFPDHDELYWNVTGDQWDVPLHGATARIELPSGTTGIRTAVFTGVYGARAEDATSEVAGNLVRIETTKSLGFHEGLTAVVGWDKGFVREPTTMDSIVLFLRANWIIFLPFVALAVMLWLWWTRGRDPRGQPISVQYDPPDQLTPGETGTLVDNQAAMRDITATLVDLAVKGYLIIEQSDVSHLLGLTHSKEYTFHRKKPPEQWLNAKPHEAVMLTALFDSGSRPDVKLSELQNHFYVNLPRIRDAIFNALVTDGYYLHRPDQVRQTYTAIGIILGVVIAAAGASVGQNWGVSQTAAILSGILTGVVIIAVGWFMPARTILGARTYEKALGFEDFLGHVEGDRLARIVNSPELFEKFLPYAMALRVEKKWVQAFSGIAMQPPSWYQGPYGTGGYSPIFLVNDLNMMSVSAGSTMASSPRSSGGSGFGGGGFSGGGGGGGGGGGF
jgi:uncharacterized membrane protein